MTKPLHDECYHQAKEKFDVYPSARANQWVAKCRKKKGIVRKTEAGESLRRWGKEEWKDEKGRPCGSGKKGETVKCRPSKRISKKTPVAWPEMSSDEIKKSIKEKKKVGMGAKASPIKKKTLKNKSPKGSSPTRRFRSERFIGGMNDFVVVKMSKSQKKQFSKNPNINPMTGRKIKINGPTYKKLVKMC